MRIPGFLGMLLSLVVLCDAYLFLRLRHCRKKSLSIIYAAVSVALYILLAIGFYTISKGQTDGNVRFMMWAGFIFLSFSTGKLIAAIFDIISFLPKIWKGKQWRAVSISGIALAAIIFVGMWWGALINRFRIEVNEVEIVLPDLPEEFDGLTITQISDLHTGTFADDTTFNAKLVEKVNSLNADIIVFTGDIVNSRTDEVLPHVSTLSRLKSPNGVYSILGNHDYGDYFKWDSPLAKKANLDSLVAIQRGMGWKLLLNESSTLHKGNDSIVIIGVENIGDPPFKCYGSLTKAYPDAGDSNFKILLSHNPAHWTDSIANRKINISLTLSGHTHAMQIEVLGLSPAVFKYPTWGGLYSDNTHTHKLYVNIGAGTVGLPMRFGATPEITLFTLRREPSVK